MASKPDEQPQDPYRVGYDQPGDPPSYSPPYYRPPAGGYTPPRTAQSPGMPTTQNNTNIVVTQGRPFGFDEPPAEQFDWTVPAILATLFCFLPTGLCAIWAAFHARDSRRRGDYEAERTATVWAKGLTLTSLIIGVVTIATVLSLWYNFLYIRETTHNNLEYTNDPYNLK